MQPQIEDCTHHTFRPPADRTLQQLGRPQPEGRAGWTHRQNFRSSDPVRNHQRKPGGSRIWWESAETCACMGEKKLSPLSLSSECNLKIHSLSAPVSLSLHYADLFGYDDIFELTNNWICNNELFERWKICQSHTV